MAGCYALQSTISSSFNPSSSSNFRFPPKSSPPSLVTLRISDSAQSLSLNFHFSVHRRNHPDRSLRFTPPSAVQEATDANVETERSPRPSGRRTLFVNNLPWSLSDDDIKELFSQCGSVTNVEFFKQENGKNRSFVHVTMGSREEAQAVIDKFDRQKVSGRVIRMEFAKSSKKPSLPPPPPEEDFTAEKTGHSVYVSNLAWKVRTNDLKEFISGGGFNPVSIRIMFDSPGKKANGYGFVSFATREEADNAISTLDGKELMGRPLLLKLSDKNAN